MGVRRLLQGTQEVSGDQCKEEQIYRLVMPLGKLLNFSKYLTREFGEIPENTYKDPSLRQALTK